MLVELGQLAVCGFICLVLFEASQYIKSLRPRTVMPGRQPAAVQPIKAEQHCPQCKEKFNGVKCENGDCGYIKPVNVSKGRTSWPNERRRLENQ